MAQSSTTDYEHQPALSGHRCCAAACDSRENTPVAQHGFAVHLHRFPSDDEVAAQWIRVLELQNMDVQTARSRRLKVCSLHFKDSDYPIAPCERRSARLRKDAVPWPAAFPPRLQRMDWEPEPLPDDIADNIYPPVLHRIDSSDGSETSFSAQSDAPASDSPALSTHAIAELRLKVKRMRDRIRSKDRAIKRLQRKDLKSGKPGDNCDLRARQESIAARATIRSRGVRWSGEQMRNAISIHHLSPAAYKYLRQQPDAALPSLTALKRRTRLFFAKPGPCRFTIAELKRSIAERPAHERIATLSLDGMRISPSIRYDAARDVIVGITPSSTSLETAKPINQAVVAHLRAVAAPWKQPIACYFANHNQSQAQFQASIEECLGAADQAGVRVKALVCDQEPAQWAHIKKTVSNSQPSFAHPTTGEAVYVVLDVPHCLKNTRNCLLKYDIEFDGDKRASWLNVREFHDSESRRQLKLAVKLTDAHINPSIAQKMKVSLAAQVFSHSVSSGMRVLVDRGLISDASLDTALFLHRMNDLFDRLNSSALIGKKGKGAVTKETADATIKQMTADQEFIRTWRFIPLNGSRTKTTMPFKEAWLLSIESAKHLISDCLSQAGHHYLCMRRFSQDHVEVSADELSFSMILT